MFCHSFLVYFLSLEGIERERPKKLGLKERKIQDGNAS